MSTVPSLAMEVCSTTSGTGASDDRSNNDTKKRSFVETEAAESLLRHHHHQPPHAGAIASSAKASSELSTSSPFGAVGLFGSPWTALVASSTHPTPPTTTTTMSTSTAEPSSFARAGGVLQVENRSIPHKKRRQHPRNDEGEGQEAGGKVQRPAPKQHRHRHQHQHQHQHQQRFISGPSAEASTTTPASVLSLRQLLPPEGTTCASAGRMGEAGPGSAVVATPPVAVGNVKSPKAGTGSKGSGGSSNGSNSNNNSDAAWMHRLYPFDGPTIEEFTPLFEGVNMDNLVEQKLAAIPDKFLATVVKGYYDKVTRLDHNQYKDAPRPPANIPEDVRPFLLSRHQLKSFNSDFLRSALRKTKVTKTFCQLLRGDAAVKGVPTDLRNLGNEAFARSIRTHQIIAYFTRYYSLFVTKRPGRILDLNDPEHKILLDCLRDIVRRVSAKRAIQRPVVDGFAAVVTGPHGQHPHQPQRPRPEPFNAYSSVTPKGGSSVTPRAPAIGADGHCEAAFGAIPESLPTQPHDPDHDGDASSHQGTLETAVSTLADEKENHEAGDDSTPQLDGSFDSFASTVETSVADDSTATATDASPGPVLPTPVNFGSRFAMTPHGSASGGAGAAAEGGRDSLSAYRTVLSMLSDEARRSVENMVRSMRDKVWEEARHSVCQRSYEEGRRVGQAEGRMWGAQEALHPRPSPLSKAP